MFHNNKTSTAYKSRVDYDQKTFEWCLRQLTETDSGSYKFTVMKNDTVQEQSYSLVVEGKGSAVLICPISRADTVLRVAHLDKDVV